MEDCLEWGKDILCGLLDSNLPILLNQSCPLKILLGIRVCIVPQWIYVSMSFVIHYSVV